jgi:hypothetical protein
MITGRHSFHGTSRYCVWIGASTALAAGVLGWFSAGFHLRDASWILMAHRWLGTSTVAFSGLVLMLSAVRCHAKRYLTRTCFAVTLLLLAVLVLATGFFGGAVVFGLEHFNWPQS